jgi:hypothetical protein
MISDTRIRQLYALAVAYDNRKGSEANITAWTEQAERNRWTFDEAREAIHEHYATSTEFLMPAHITAIVRRGRNHPPTVDQARELPPAPPADPQRIREVVTELARRLGWRYQHADDEERAAIQAVECPHCHAAPNRPCARQLTRGHRRGEWVKLAQFHPSRMDIARAAKEDA